MPSNKSAKEKAGDHQRSEEPVKKNRQKDAGANENHSSKRKAEVLSETPREYSLRKTPQRKLHDLKHPEEKRKKLQDSSPSDGSDMLKLLWRTSTADLELEGEVYSTTRDSRLLTCFEELADRQYYSCPVLTQKNQFFNFIDVMDITRFTVAHFAGCKSFLEDPNNFWELLKRHHDFEALTVDHLTKSPNTRKNWYGLPVPSTYSLLHVAELMAREVSLHRVAIVDDLESRTLQGIVTQSRLVKFIWENIKLLGMQKLSTKVKDFSEVFHEVFTVHKKSTALAAFQLMSDKSVTGLPVVDDDNQLVGSISIKDIKGMASDGSLFFRLYQPLHSFLANINSVMEMEAIPLVYCTKRDKFSTVIDRLVFNKVHRLPIVECERDKKVIGIITLRDVLRMALFR